MKLSRTSSREAFMVEGLSPYVTVFLVYRGPHRPHLDHLRHVECILVLSTLILLTPFQMVCPRNSILSTNKTLFFSDATMPWSRRTWRINATCFLCSATEFE